MSIDQKSLLDLESQRLESIAEMEANEGLEWAERYEPGTFGCHELLDRLHLVSSMFQQFVMEHPGCLQNPEWHRLAAIATEAMEELYQMVGEAHLGEDRDE